MDAKATSAKAGRPVTIVSIGFPNGRTVDEVAAIVDREAAGADLVALPETWLGQGDREPETLDGPAVSAMAELARQHRTYIVCPIDRRDGERRLNTAVLLDRGGRVVCTYDKIYPYWAEFDIRPAVTPGADAPVHQADFGRVGMAICFDVNFPEVWQRLADGGAELVVWSSAYSAGTTLQAHSLMHHYPIVSTTQTPDCFACDITGQPILYERGDDLNITRLNLDLDRCIFHEDFNVEPRDRLLAERGGDVEQELHLWREKWFVLRAKRPGASARALAQEYGLEELRDYIHRSRREIDALRGWPFGKPI